MLFMVTGSSGVGKSTLIKCVMGLSHGLVYLPSDSTRLMRKGESQGNPYNFVDRETFLQRVSEGKYVEYFENYGNLYGTHEDKYRDAMERGFHPIKDIDTRGALAFKERFGEKCVTIFVKAPSVEELVSRVENRDGFVDGTRLSAISEESKQEHLFDYTLVNNNLEESTRMLLCIIEKHVREESLVI